MIDKKKVIRALPHVLKTIDLPHLGKKYQGKVRDFYKVDGKRILITTDRQSAFDVILGNIPYKGAVLNQLSQFWFEKTQHIVPNHLESVPHPNISIVKNCEPLPVEMVVRDFISGVTKTSIWHSYEKGERLIYGIKFPHGLKKNQKLSKPVITPTTHPEAGSTIHDERLTREEIIRKKIIPEKLYRQMEKVALELFEYGSKLCKKQGLVLVDTKYEFGLHSGKLTLIDEIHTPDSSRFWIAKTYEERFKKGVEPENFDKEFLRLWYAKRGYRGDGPPPSMPASLITALALRYISVFEKITGNKFVPLEYPIEGAIKDSLLPYSSSESQRSRTNREVSPDSGQTRMTKVSSRLRSNHNVITYAQVGDNYDTKDPIKKLAQDAAASTAKNLKSSGFFEVSDSRGESAYVWKQGNSYMASVIEGLGTKNLIADGMNRITNKTYYDVIAHDTVATIINDLVSVGATPLVLHAYWSIEDNEWLHDKARMTALIQGWKKACDIAGVSWGGGETATMKGIVVPQTADLAGCAIGIVKNKKNLITDKNLKSGDRILLIKSNGVNANGISLTRAIGKKLPKGYGTKLSSGKLYGEALLTKTNIYAGLVQALQKANIQIHYISNITGHGLRKLMRARGQFSYVIERILKPQEIFLFIQKHAHLPDYEMYQTYNMGMDYALFVSGKDVSKTQKIIKQQGFASLDAGFIEKGERQVIIKPKNITYSGKTLDLR